MKKLVAEVFSLHDDTLFSQFYCIGEDGRRDAAVSSTLCRMAGEFLGPPLEALLTLLDAVASGNYAPPDADVPDMSVNGKEVWLCAPFAPAGQVLISNRHIASGEGVPQLFSYEQVRIAAQLAVRFQFELTTQGEENLVGQRFEVDLPD